MKKFLLSTFALLAMVSTAFGADGLSVENVYLSTTGTTDFPVFVTSDVKSTISGVQFDIQLPAGVEFVKEGNDPVYQLGTTIQGSPSVVANIDNGVLKVAIGSDNTVKVTKGMLIAFKIQPSSSVSAGTVLTGAKIFNVQGSKTGEGLVSLSGCNFDITVTDRVVLDENSPFAITTTGSGKNVLLKRSLKANTWSTIYLPFRVTYSKLKTAFGDDVEYARFNGWSSENPGDDICIDFSRKTGEAMTSLTPYLIKVSATNDEFLFSSVTFGEYVDPSDNSKNSVNPINIYNTDIKVYDPDEEIYSYAKGTMTGNLVMHAMGANELFLQDNKFYYSAAGQNIKGFRATFTFKDPSGNVYLMPNGSSARAKLSINGQSIDEEDTGINSMILTAKTGKVYSVSGQYMGENVDLKSLPKGVYIVDGNKVVNK